MKKASEVNDAEWQMIDLLQQNPLIRHATFSHKTTEDLRTFIPTAGDSVQGDFELVSKVLAEHSGIAGQLKRDKNIQIEWTNGLEHFTIKHKLINSKIIFRTISGNPTVQDFALIQKDFKEIPDIGALLVPTSAFNPDVDENPREQIIKAQNQSGEDSLPYPLQYKLAQDSFKEYIEIFVLNKEINDFYEGLLFEKYKNKRASFNFEGNILLSYAVDAKGLENGSVYLSDIYHEELIRLLNDKINVEDSLRIWEQLRLFNLLEVSRVTQEALNKGCFNCGPDLSLQNIDKSINLSERLSFMTRDSQFPTKFKSDLMGSFAVEAFLKNRGKTVYAVVDEMFIEQTLKKFLSGLEQVRITSDYSFKFPRMNYLSGQVLKYKEIDPLMIEEDDQIVHKNAIFEAIFGMNVDFDTEEKRKFYQERKSMLPNYAANQLLENWIIDSQDKKAYNAVIQSDRCGAVNLLFNRMEMIEEENEQTSQEPTRALTYAEARAEAAKIAEAKLNSQKTPVAKSKGSESIDPREAAQQKKLSLKQNAPSSSKKKKK